METHNSDQQLCVDMVQILGRYAQRLNADVTTDYNFEQVDLRSFQHQEIGFLSHLG